MPSQSSRAELVVACARVAPGAGLPRSLSLRSESAEIVLRRQVRPEETAGMTAIDQHEPPRAADQDYITLFPVLWQKAYVVAYRVLGSKAGAEDVAQETMARAYSWWSRISKSPQGWVAKVAYGMAIDAVRRQKTARAALVEASEVDERDPRIEDRMDLMAAIERLPRRQRQVVVLRYLADQSEIDTASALGLRVTTVRRHATRALASLGGHLVRDLQEG
jgi:RNA polymerase sigma factor (sigma-70 family)